MLQKEIPSFVQFPCGLLLHNYIAFSPSPKEKRLEIYLLTLSKTWFFFLSFALKTVVKNII